MQGYWLPAKSSFARGSGIMTNVLHVTRSRDFGLWIPILSARSGKSRRSAQIDIQIDGFVYRIDSIGDNLPAAP